LFDEAGELTSESTKAFFGSFMGAFADWIDRNRLGTTAAD
jgi:hypothetical protein